MKRISMMVNGVTHLRRGNPWKGKRCQGEKVPMSERRMTCRTCRQVLPGTDFDISDYTGEPLSVCRACRATQKKSWADVKKDETPAAKPASPLAQAVAKHHATRAAKVAEQAARQSPYKAPRLTSHTSQKELTDADASAMQWFVDRELPIPRRVGDKIVCKCGFEARSWGLMVAHAKEVLGKHFG